LRTGPQRESEDMGNGLRTLSRIKPYKAAAPEDTILRIKSLLTNLGLNLVEDAIPQESGRFSHLLRLIDSDCGETVFQTVGKGRTDAYSRASAYGEMIERIQNLAFYMMLIYPSQPETDNSVHYVPFKYYPDEKTIMGEELHSGMRQLFGKHSGQDGILQINQAIGVPFWNIFTSHTEYLPFRALQVIVGSNGMCSGNTPAETLIHGICEVFERHVLKQLFLVPHALPDIPLELFTGHSIHDDLYRLAGREGYSISIKDCSLRLRLPVIGLLIRDRYGHYAFHLGADPSPVTALERCFTEMYQGGNVIFKEMNDLESASGDVWTSEFWKTQLHLNIRSYEGHWPPAILMQKSESTFEGFDHPVSNSDEQDLAYVIKIVQDAGWDLLIRDNSFLGFPSYHVYIPGISEMTNALDNSFAKQHMEFDQNIHVVTNPAGSTPAEREAAVRAIEKYSTVAPSRQFQPGDFFMFYRQHPLAEMSQEALKVLLLKDFPPSQSQNLPACFYCESCRHLNRCSHSFLCAIWTRMKQAMVSMRWSQNDIAIIMKGAMDRTQPVKPGEMQPL
jgi:ribosomal protein S12 methylthiotransferase accessory factor